MRLTIERIHMSIKVLTEATAINLGMTQSQAKEAITEIFAEITIQLEAGSEVSIPGFGKFISATQVAKSGVMAGKAWTSAAKQVPKFKPASTLKDAVA